MFNSQDWDPILDDRVKIRNQSAVEEAEEPESEARQRIVTVPKFNAWLGLPEVGITVFATSVVGQWR